MFLADDCCIMHENILIFWGDRRGDRVGDDRPQYRVTDGSIVVPTLNICCLSYANTSLSQHTHSNPSPQQCAVE